MSKGGRCLYHASHLDISPRKLQPFFDTAERP